MKQYRYDVFLSYNEADQALVTRLAQKLQGEDLTPFFGPWVLIPGTLRQEELERGLDRSRTCAVFVGANGVGPWENEEMRAAIERRVSDPEFRVIPVLLPGADWSERGRLPPFLRRTVWVEFRDNLDDPVEFRRLMAGVQGISPGPDGGGIEPGACPYPGLRTFTREDARFFFGREALTQWLVNHLRSDRFLAVVGPSGSGKSSLVRAGLIPALERGALPGGAAWEKLVFRPGHRPLENLAFVLRPFLETEAGDLRRLIDGLAADERQLHLTVKTALPDGDAEQRTLLVVDQFEEVFTLCRDEAGRRAFIDSLLYASSIPGGQAVVVLTMRSDFYGRCAAYPDLSARITDHQVFVNFMAPDELRTAIERPAQLARLTFDEGLVDTLLADVRDQPGALPLLQHTLRELCLRQTDRRLTHWAYREIGGVDGAVAHRAEEVYGHFDDRQQRSARALLLRLVQPGEGTEDTRRRAHMHEFDVAQEPSLQAAMDALVQARLLTLDTDADGRQTVDVSHEALIRAWPRLQEWIDEARADLQVHRQLTRAAEEWERNGRDVEYLVGGNRLRRLRTWAQQRAEELAALERAFLDACVAAQRRRWLRRAVGAIGVLVLGTIIYGLWPRPENPWQQVIGFPEDDVLALAAAPHGAPVLYAGTGSIGLARSEDGRTWTPYRSGLPVGEPKGGDAWRNVEGIGPLAVDPRSGRLYAYVAHSGVYASDDGTAWAPTGPSFPAPDLVDLAVAGELLAGTSSVRNDAGRLYVSADAGRNWQRQPIDVDTGPAPPAVYTVHIDADGDLLAGAETGIFLAVNAGATPPASWTWQHYASTAPVILIEPGQSGGYYVVLRPFANRSTLYRWRPGAAWEAVAPPMDNTARALVVDRTSSSYLVYVLLVGGGVQAVTAEGALVSYGSAASFAYSLLQTADGRLLLGVQGKGLYEYRGAFVTGEIRAQ